MNVLSSQVPQSVQLCHSWFMHVSVERLLSSEPYEVGEWAVFLPIKATFTDLESVGLGDFQRITMAIDVVGDKAGVTELTAIAVTGGVVTGTGLRTIPVLDLMRNAITSVIANKRGDGYSTPWHFDGVSVREAGPTDESLKIVASIYKLARFAGDHPARTVEKWLDMPRTTASQWVRKARERGFLDVRVR